MRCAQAAPTDVVLLAGKGHEDYQEVAASSGPSRQRRGRAPGRVAAPQPGPRGGSAHEGLPPPMMTLAQAARAAARMHAGGRPATPILRVHTDTRTLRRRPVRGAARRRFDAHDFLPQARAAGAAAALAEHGWPMPGCPACRCRHPGWRCSSWPRLARALRPAADRRDRQQRQDHRHPDGGRHPARLDGRARTGHRRQLNNHIGVPLTLLRLRAGARPPRRRVELGMNHPGEIALLAAWRADGGPGQQRAARAPGVHGHVEAVAQENGAGHHRAAGRRRGRLPGRRCLHAPCGAPGRQPGRSDHLRDAGRGRCHRCAAPATWVADADRRPLAVRVHTPPARPRFSCTSRAAQRAQRAGRQRPARWPPACRWRGGAGAGRLPPGGKGRSQPAAAAAGPAARHAGGRQLQRQPRFGACRHRRAGRRCRARAGWCWATWARWATRARVPRRGGRLCARQRGIELFWTAAVRPSRRRPMARGPPLRRCAGCCRPGPPRPCLRRGAGQGISFMQMERVVQAALRPRQSPAGAPPDAACC
jgi:hypothetical protein